MSRRRRGKEEKEEVICTPIRTCHTWGTHTRYCGIPHVSLSLAQLAPVGLRKFDFTALGTQCSFINAAFGDLRRACFSVLSLSLSRSLPLTHSTLSFLSPFGISPFVSHVSIARF